MNKPDISIKTLRSIIDSFESCLSKTEISNETNKLILRVIREVSLKQISLIAMNDKIIIDNLEFEISELKNLETYEKNKSK